METSTKRIVVREAQGKSGRFNYLVEDYQVIRDREE